MAKKGMLGQIEERWISILEFLNRSVEILTTRDIADYIGCDTAVTGNALRQMAKKELIKSSKIGGKREWWVERPAGAQYSFFQELAPDDTPRLKRVVRKARKPCGSDAGNWISVTLGKRAYISEVPQATITWEVADKILKNFRGSPADLRIKLSWGAGSVAEWKCGCKVVTSWKYARPELHECEHPVCIRNVALSKTASIPINECAFTFTAPGGMSLGQTYRLICGCTVVVAEVVYVTGIRKKAGVLAQRMGTVVCVKHKAPHV